MKKKTTKKLLTGLEVEHILLDMDGRISNDSDKIIADCKAHKKDATVVKECATSMVELGAYPSVKVKNTCVDYLDNIQLLIDVAAMHDNLIYPLSVPPLSYHPKMRHKKWYALQERLIFGGKSKYEMAGKTAAFHFHYTLPKGIFDWKKRFPKRLFRSRAAQNMLNSYNLAISMDPAMVTLMQSSPYLDGRYVAKDTRVLIQRTGRVFPFQGIYSTAPKLAGLPIYKHTLTDLLQVIENRHSSVKSLLVKAGLSPNLVYRYGKILQYSWHSVRVNKIGTMELRSMDVNHPKYVTAATVLLKFINRAVNLYNYDVIPSDIGIEEPFRIEGEKIYIPPHTHVRKTLQYLSAYEGFDSKEIYNYSKRFMSMARRFTDKEYYPAVKSLSSIVDRKKTVSDVLIAKFKKKGFGKKDKIPNDVCSDVMLDSTTRLLKEVYKTRKTVEGLEL
ncbi:hypothetical protein JW968_05950 [Candidatus Woesearchaeota archaeon]|nr:hypothetical protein [Candidatus Woesearchaeota archaeon]